MRIWLEAQIIIVCQCVHTTSLCCDLLHTTDKELCLNSNDIKYYLFWKNQSIWLYGYNDLLLSLPSSQYHRSMMKIKKLYWTLFFTMRWRWLHKVQHRMVWASLSPSKQFKSMSIMCLCMHTRKTFSSLICLSFKN